MKTFMLRFVRFTNRWFIDLDVPISEIGNLEMVMGADVLLDKISEQVFNGSGDVTLCVSKVPNADGDRIALTKSGVDFEGATYAVSADNIKDAPSTIWLCNVCKDVLGSHPQNIYITF